MFFPLSNRWLIQFPPNFIFSCKGHCLLYSEYLESTEFFLFSAEILSSLIPSQCSSDQSFSRVRLFVTSWTAARQASLSITNSQSLLKLVSIELVMPSSHLILCHPLLLKPPIVPNIRVFSNESAFRIRWPNIGIWASTSVLQMNTQDWSPLEWTGWISLQSMVTGIILSL